MYVDNHNIERTAARNMVAYRAEQEGITVTQWCKNHGIALPTICPTNTKSMTLDTLFTLARELNVEPGAIVNALSVIWPR